MFSGECYLSCEHRNLALRRRQICTQCHHIVDEQTSHRWRENTQCGSGIGCGGSGCCHVKEATACECRAQCIRRSQFLLTRGGSGGGVCGVGSGACRGRRRFGCAVVSSKRGAQYGCGDRFWGTGCGTGCGAGCGCGIALIGFGCAGFGCVQENGGIDSFVKRFVEEMSRG